MNSTIVHITQWLLDFRYLVLFPLAVVEGPIVTIIVGSLAALHVFNLFTAYAIIVVADLFADALYYILGRFGRETFIRKYGRYFGLSIERTMEVEEQYRKRGGQLLIIGKFSHGIGGIFLVAAGLAKMPFSNFIFYNLGATIVKSLALLLLGFYFSEMITNFNSIFDLVAIILTISLITAGILYFRHSYKKLK